jgi:hypothetical protein
MTQITPTPMTYPEREYLNVPLEKIETPGCYVSKNTGTLYRIPAEALAGGPNARIGILSKEGTMMTKIAADPWLPINTARRLCANADVQPNF